MALTKIPSSLLDTSGGFDLQGNITLGDNEKVILGDSSDLQIYHDGSNSFVADVGTGVLDIQTNGTEIQMTKGGAEYMAKLVPDGAVTLYYDNAAKIATTSTGIDVTGVLTATSVNTGQGDYELYAMDQNVRTTDSPAFAAATINGTLTVTGNLDITGDINSYNVTDLDVTDKTITLGAGQTEANSGGSGIIIDGSSASILWDETNDVFDINKGLTASGNIGFGTSSPNNYSGYTTLTFNNATYGGAIDFENNGTRVGTIFSDQTSTILKTVANVPLLFGANDAEKMRIASDGKVGIGAQSPSSFLTVSGSEGSQYVGSFTNTSSQGWGLFVQAGADADDYSFRIRNKDATDIFAVKSGGNVGIGRTDPTQLLEVHKSTGGDQTVAKFSAHNYGDTGKTFIEIGTEYGDGSSRIGSFNNTGNSSVLVFDTHSATSGQFTERMRIDSSGNVGIGLTPSGYLTLGYVARLYGGTQTYISFNNSTHTTQVLGGFVVGNDASAARITQRENQPMIFATNDLERMRITNGGDVSIGSDHSGFSGWRVLNLRGEAGAGALVNWESNNATRKAAIAQNGSNLRLQIFDNGSITFEPGTGAERMRIDSSGKLLIGDSASHTDDLLQIETPASGGGHGIQIRRNDSNSDQGIGHIQFGNNTDTDLAKIAATTDGGTDNARLSFWTQPDSGSLTERVRISHDGHFMFNTTANAGFKYFIVNQVNDGALIFRYNNTDKWQQSLDSSTYDKMFYSYTASRHVMKMHADGRDFDFTSDTANDYTPRLNLYSKSTGAYAGEINFYSKHNSNEWVCASIFATGASGYGTGNPPSGGMRLYVRGQYGDTHALNAVDINASGVVSGDFNDTSDVALKKDIFPLNASDSLTAIKALNPVSFKWKLDDEKRSGFIAQEVEKHLPDDVIGEDWRAEIKGEEGDPTRRDEGSKGKAVNTTGILAHAVKVIQEQQTIIDDLKSRIEALEG